MLVPIALTPSPCQSYVDICGVCNGPGPIYDCGCQELPDWACDCEGNQLDALGECGGNCLGDYDGDGICDEYVPGVCAGQESLTYHGEEYEITEIAGRCWFTENLKTYQYSNGDTITHVSTGNQWAASSTAFESTLYIYNDFQANEFLYNWYAADDQRNICPTGWSAPTYLEVSTMIDSISSTSSLTGYELTTWTANQFLDNDNWDGTNSTGFSAYPTPYVTSSGSIADPSNVFHSWTSSSWEESGRYFKLYNTGQSTIPNLYNSNASKGQGYVVRCIKD